MFGALKTMARTPVRACALVLLVGVVTAALLGCTLRAENDTTGNKNKGEEDMATATFAAGCFWGVEATFRDVKGVTDTEVGYTGGDVSNPTYKEVCTGDTGHAEAVRVNYDPDVVTYEELLDVFWGCHNPTTKNRQGPDVGTQYRSVIFYHTPEQEEAARTSKKELNESDAYDRPIVTRITPADTFYRAEEYHQQYLEKQGGVSCGL